MNKGERKIIKKQYVNKKNISTNYTNDRIPFTFTLNRYSYSIFYESKDEFFDLMNNLTNPKLTNEDLGEKVQEWFNHLLDIKDRKENEKKERFKNKLNKKNKNKNNESENETENESEDKSEDEQEEIEVQKIKK